MVQSLFGCTPYEEQSLEDILSDIRKWQVDTLSIHDLFVDTIGELKSIRLKNGTYFDSIDFNFQMTILNTVKITNSFLYDLKIIEKSIVDNKIKNSDVKLLKNIGIRSAENNVGYGRDFKNDYSWHNYGESNFSKAENLYKKGRDFFVTLSDALSAADRLEDYKDMNNNTEINITGNGHNIQTGNNSTMNIGISTGSQNEVALLLKGLLDNMDEYFSDKETEKKEEAKEHLEFISEEIKKESPKKSILKNSLTALKCLSTSATFVNTVLSIGTTLNLM